MEPPRKKQKVESQNECSNQNNLIGVDSCLWKNWNSIQKSYSQTKTLNPMTHRERMKEAKVFYDSLTNDTNWPHTLVNKLRSHRVIAHTSKAIPQSHPAKPSRMKKISTFFKPAKSSRNRPPITPQTQQQVMAMRNEPLKHSATKPMMSASPATPAVKPKRKYVKPKQQQMKEQLRVMDEEIAANEITLNGLKKLDKQLYDREKNVQTQRKSNRRLLSNQLKKLKRHNANMHKYRQKRREQMKQLKQLEKEEKVQLDDDVCFYESPGRPRIELTRRGKDLANIMEHEAAPHTSTNARRRASDNIINLSLPKFTEKVNDNINERSNAEGRIHKPISTQTLYMRTIPSRVNSHHGKKHKVTTNLKFRKPQKTKKKKHPSAHFCLSMRKSVDSFAAALGDANIIYIELDDKARAPIGITLASAKPRMLCGLQQFKLSDHDFPYGPSHAFIVSVYRVYTISVRGGIADNKRVSWSGPGMVFIRSAYHEHQSAYNHALDIEAILEDERFDYVTKNENKEMPTLTTKIIWIPMHK